jgi:hypothetical protein
MPGYVCQRRALTFHEHQPHQRRRDIDAAIRSLGTTGEHAIDAGEHGGESDQAHDAEDCHDHRRPCRSHIQNAKQPPISSKAAAVNASRFLIIVRTGLPESQPRQMAPSVSARMPPHRVEPRDRSGAIGSIAVQRQ